MGNKMKFLGITKFDGKFLHLITAKPNEKFQNFSYNVYSQELFQNDKLVLKGKIYAISSDNTYKIEII